MRIVAIDPGPSESAYVVLVDGVPVEFDKIESELLLENIRYERLVGDHLAIEMVESFGMAVGKEVFQTVFYSGRFVEAWRRSWTPIYRKQVKMHLCQSMRAKDANIRQALIDKFGGPEAIGRNNSPGPLYGIAGDCWSALAVAITFSETSRELIES